MDINRYTFTVQEGIASAQQLAARLQNPEIDIVHLWKALLDIPDSLLASIYDRNDLKKETVEDYINGLIDKKPQVSGAASGQYISGQFQQLLSQAEIEAGAWRINIYPLSIWHLRLWSKRIIQLLSFYISETLRKKIYGT